MSPLYRYRLAEAATVVTLIIGSITMPREHVIYLIPIAAVLLNQSCEFNRYAKADIKKHDDDFKKEFKL